MLTPYLMFHGTCEEAFRFYAEAFGGGETVFTRLDNNPTSPVVHASVVFTKYEGCIMGADIDVPVEISDTVICVVLPSRETVAEIAVKLSAGGRRLQELLPPPLQNSGGMGVLDQYGYTWYLTT